MAFNDGERSSTAKYGSVFPNSFPLGLSIVFQTKRQTKNKPTATRVVKKGCPGGLVL